MAKENSVEKVVEGEVIEEEFDDGEYVADTKIVCCKTWAILSMSKKDAETLLKQKRGKKPVYLPFGHKDAQPMPQPNVTTNED